MPSDKTETGKKVSVNYSYNKSDVILRIFFLTLLLFITDQISKLFVKGFSLPMLNIKHTGLGLGETKPLIGSILNITLVENPGIAFGIIPGSVLKELILILTILLCVGLVVCLATAKNADRRVRLSIGLILAGAAGNLFDRIFYGYFFDYAPLFHGRVVDFLDVKVFKIFMFGEKLGNYIFNFADLSITMGIFTLIYFIFRIKNQNKEFILVQNLSEERQDKA